MENKIENTNTETSDKKLIISDIINQRELLISFINWHDKHYAYEKPEYSDVDTFLDEINSL
jgi:hypothetical protein